MSLDQSVRPAPSLPADPPRNRWKIVCIIAAVLISAAGWVRIRFDNSLEPLLPQNSEARETILFFRDSSFASKAILWFRLRGDGSPEDLYAAADKIEKHLDPTLIKQVLKPPTESSALDEVMGMLDDAGELLNADDLVDIKKAISPPALAKRMRELYLQLVEPQGSFMTGIMQRDPLGVSTRILGRLSALQSALGFKVEVKDGHLMNPDGRQMLVMLETNTTATNMASSRELAAYLNSLAAQAPPNVEIIPISGLIHAEQNEELMQRDIHLAAGVNLAAFILLFFLVSRDLRIAIVFMLPLVTTAITIGWCALVHPSLSTMMIGLAVTMAGSAVDYGIYVYTAITLGSNLKSDLRRIRRPILISHLTTLGVFIAFLFSRIPAFRQLGYMASISLVMSLLTALFVLPGMIRPRGKLAVLGSGMPLQRWGHKMFVPAIVCCVALVALTFAALRVRIDPDITRLDGVTPVVRQNEADFQTNWSRSDKPMAMLVVTAPTRDQAEEANDEVNQTLAAKVTDFPVASMSNLWPSAATRAANLARWQAFWTPQRVSQFRQDLADAGKPYGFSADAFAPFFQSLTSPPKQDQPRQIIQSLEDQFVSRSNGDWQMLNYFEDSPDHVAQLRSALAGRSDVQIVSRGALGQAFADSAKSETKILVGISAAFIILSLVLLTHSFRKSAIVMFPAITGLIGMLAALVIISQGMSIVTVIAAILVLALGSDYGVFAIYAWEGREPLFGQGMSSVLLSFLTTLAGTGALLFAHHPALFLAGVSLTSGLVAAYLTVLVVIPAFEYLRERSLSRRPA
jgi:predicted exporter